MTQKSVEVWIFDPASRRIMLREVFNKVDDSPLEARTTVLHAVELLRWSLSEHDPSRASQPKANAREIPPARAPRQSPWSLDGGALLALSPEGTSVGMGASVGVAWRAKQLGARAFAGSLLLPHRLTLNEGEMEVKPSWCGLEGVLFLESPRSPLKYQVGAGLALLNVYLRGISSSLDAHSESYLTAAPLLDLRAFGKMNEVLALGVTATGMVPLRSDVLRVDEQEVARYGKVIIALGIGLELSL